MSRKFSDQWWWFGVPLSTGLVSWLPYWAWNLAGGISTWWRVPAVTPGLFDTYVYLHWMAAAAERLPYGGHLKWFGVILAGLWSLIGRFASIPELWIVSRWITFTLVIWVAAMAFERWGGLERAWARLLSLGFFAAVVLTLGMRPGVYAWYLPFCIAGLLCVRAAALALDRRDLVRSAAWTIAAVCLTWIYPWFFMIAGLWLAVLWISFIARIGRWIPLVAIGGLTALAVGSSVPLARWFLDPAHAGLVGVYERNGMAFAHIPFFANTVLAIGAWIVFLFVLARRESDAARRNSLIFLGGGWMTIALLWFHTPFTGLHTYSDHFIGPVTVMAWLTLAAVWAWTGRASLREEHFAILRITPITIAICSTIFFLYVLQQPLRFNLHKFDSYVIHLAHWLALAIAGWIAVWRMRHPSTPMPNKIIAIATLTLSVLVGMGGILPAFFRDIPKVPGVMARVPVISWIAEYTRPSDQMCADPESASFFAAQTGRVVFPAEATLSWPDPSAVIIEKLKTLVGGYDVRASGNTDMFQFYTDHYRTIPCAAESKYSHNAPYARALASFGFTEAQVNDLIGCDKKTIDTNRARVNAAIEAHQLREDAFRSLCPSVIMPAAQKPYWTLPAGYVEHPITSEFSVWQTN